MSTHHPQSNLKKVLRIALIGVKPANQVILKGYLRVLLRLEVDLEWVSATHPNVDLFIINNDFRQADSVSNLLAGQPNKPVLYSSRTDIDEGWMTEDRIILPLKKLDALNEWLQHSVKVLNQGANDTAETQLSTQPDSPEKRRLAVLARINESKAVLAKGKAGANESNDETTLIDSAQHEQNTAKSEVFEKLENPPNATDHNSSMTTNDVAESPRKLPSRTIYRGMIAFIKALQQRPSGLYQIANGEQPIAIVDPLNSLMWLSEDATADNSISLTLDWQLHPYSGERPAINDAGDMTQQLWELAWLQVDILLPLISDEQTYRLQHWIKPVITNRSLFAGKQSSTGFTKKDRQSLISIMTALENAPCSVNQLACNASISVKSVKKIIAGLLFSGSLQSKAYEKIDTQVRHSPNANVDIETEKPVLTLSIEDEDTGIDAKLDSSNRHSFGGLSLDNDTYQTSHELSAAQSRSISQREHAMHNESAANESTATLNNVSTERAFDTDSYITDQSESASSMDKQATPAQQAKRGFLSRLRSKLGL